MNKKELAVKLSEKTGLSTRRSEAGLQGILDSITTAMSQGDFVRISGFGTFRVKERNSRLGYNPKTNSVNEIPERKVPVFRAGTGLKSEVNV